MTYAERISRERQGELESQVRACLNGTISGGHAQLALLMDGLNAERAEVARLRRLLAMVPEDETERARRAEFEFRTADPFEANP